MHLPEISYTCVDRFLKYVTFDTQSSETSETFPSTLKQKVLGEELVTELLQMGLPDAKMDEFGYVTATIPATSTKSGVPVIGLIAHMDTSPEVSGANVKAVVHENYDGGDIILPGDSSVVIRPVDHPHLKEKVGETIITSDGTTLLGADNKAGIAEIFDAAHHLLSHPELPHGTIRICITPDEEVGQGTKHFDLKGFGADFAYTIDGEESGSIENETFCADSITFSFVGINTHPGFAKDRMVNSLKVASDFLGCLPKGTLAPEHTADKEGYVHPYVIHGGVEETSVKFLLRSFDVDELRVQERLLRSLADETIARWPGARIEVKVEESYRNMRYVLDHYPHVIDHAVEAIRRAGVEPKLGSIRGGTDGARLSAMGLPCPNLFAGEHAFHSKQEWISVQDMQKAVRTIIHLAMVWEERA